MPKLEPYSKKLSYSYALGVFPSLMLLEARPDTALRLLLHPAGEENEGVAKLRQRCAELGVREEQAERVLHEADRLQGMVADARQSLAGTFRLAILPTIAPYLLPRFFPRLCREHPEMDLRVVEM